VLSIQLVKGKQEIRLFLPNRKHMNAPNRFDEQRRAEQMFRRSISHVAQMKPRMVADINSNAHAGAQVSGAASTNAPGKFILGYSRLGGPDVLG
jgi:hypothetical protein